MLESIFVHIFEDCNYHKNKMASLYICAQSFARVTPQGHHTGEKSLDYRSCIWNNTTYIIFYCFSYVIKCTFESHNKRSKKKNKNRKNIQKNGGFFTATGSDVTATWLFILKSDKILYRHYILSTPALFYAESTALLAKSRILVYYQFMLIMQNSRSRDSFKLLLQHFHHIFLKSTHDKL